MPVRPLPALRFPALLWAVHHWLGWTFGAVFALIGLTGSVLVIKDAVDAGLNPACYQQAAATDVAAAAPSIADVLRTAYAGTAITDVDTVFLPERPGGPWVLRAERGDDDVEVFVRYDAGAVLCARAWEDTLIGVVSRFHTGLLIPFDWRHEVVAVLAGADLLLVLAGLLLYLRRCGGRRTGPRPGGRKRARWLRWPQWHSGVGLAAAPLLLLPIITGAAMSVNSAARDLASLVLPFADPPPRAKPVRLTAPPIGPDAALAAGAAAIAGAVPQAVVLPALEGAPYRVFVRPLDDGRTRSGGSASILVGPAQAQVAAVIDPLHGRVGDRVFAARFPLHTGEMWYAPGRVLAFLSGLAPAALLATAAAAWRARRRRRQVASRLGRTDAIGETVQSTRNTASLR